MATIAAERGISIEHALAGEGPAMGLLGRMGGIVEKDLSGMRIIFPAGERIEGNAAPVPVDRIVLEMGKDVALTAGNTVFDLTGGYLAKHGSQAVVTIPSGREGVEPSTVTIGSGWRNGIGRSTEVSASGIK